MAMMGKAIKSGDSVCLKSPTHGDEYVEACGHAGGGFGVSTRKEKSAHAKFEIFHWSGSGAITSGDSVYLRADDRHNKQCVEASGRAGGGYGVSTRAQKNENSEFKIFKWSGPGVITRAMMGEAIMPGDSIYLQANARHGNEYVEVAGHAGGGYGLSTRAQHNMHCEFLIFDWNKEEIEKEVQRRVMEGDREARIHEEVQRRMKGQAPASSVPTRAVFNSSRQASVFLSMRFTGGRPLPLGLEVRSQLEQMGVIVTPKLDPGLDDRRSEIAKAISNCSVFVVFGTEDYGEDTGNPMCSYNEFKFATVERKNIAHIKMCDNIKADTVRMGLTGNIWKPESLGAEELAKWIFEHIPRS